MEKREGIEAAKELIEAARILSDRTYQDRSDERELSAEARKTAMLIVKFLHEAKLARLGKAVLLCALIGSLSACLPAIGEMPATGWRVTFGIDPIDGLNDTRRLDQVKPRAQNVKY